ncbi:MAG: hypothetical protein CMF62_04355 [Magnetococcales bacterium]|nr:hypothetical protein [Magnetococcales bacterium]
MVEYSCKKCNYRTTYKSHYERHCLSKKHIKNNNYQDKLSYYKCYQCKYKTTRKDCYENHIKKHINNYNTNKNISFEEFKNFQFEMMERLDEKDQKIIELVNKSNTTNITNNNQTVYNYIVNNIKPTTNIHSELEKPLTDEEIQYITANPALDGVYFFINNRFLKDRSNDEKILVCCDVARNKYYYFGKDDKWHLDMKLKYFFKQVYNKLSNIYIKHIEFNTSEYDKKKFLDKVQKQVDGYNGLNKTLKDKPIKLLHKINKDTIIIK